MTASIVVPIADRRAATTLGAGGAAHHAPHPWKLVAPWYRWSAPGVPSAGRTSRPVFQKYDSPQLVAEFLADPQRSLKFTTEDRVQDVIALPPLSPDKFAGKPRRLATHITRPGTIRKLFLDTHKRFYLVVCELHCDVPGFPTAGRAPVCEAGFVVRRRVVAPVPAVAAREIGPVLREIATTRQQLTIIDQTGCLAVDTVATAKAAVAAGALRTRSGLVDRLTTLRREFDGWVTRHKVATELQGWRPLRDRVGRWAEVEPTPRDVYADDGTPLEHVFPLYPLIPDPRDTRHSARGRTIYFGLVPTASADHDEHGHARFEGEQTDFEIRCFVRRHRDPCPRSSRRPDCHGHITWSAPTEPYRIAPHFDLIGTSNQRTTIQLPDLDDLRAQSAALPPARLAPVRMAARQSLDAKMSGGGVQKIGIGGAQICSFALPVITIVATFLFRLFLPIVTLLFGLFFLLRLKFCIPPSIELSAGIKAELDATMPSVDADFGLSVDLEFRAIGEPDFGDPDGPEFGAEVSTALDGYFGTEAGTTLEAQLGPAARARLVGDVAAASHANAAPLLTAGLEYEAHVEPEARP